MAQSNRHEARVTLRLLGALLGGLALLGGVSLWLSHRAEGQTVTLFVTGDSRGYLEPCGCRRDQAGGLPARQTLVRENAAPNRLLVDVGNVTNGGRSYELLKLRYLLEGMKRMGYDVVNLGLREAGLDRDTLKKIVAESGAPFVSCNVLDRSTGAPLAEPYRLKSVAGIQVGITGVAAAEEEEIGPGVRVRPAAEALAELLPRLKSQCDFVIVLAFVPAETLRTLADRFQEIDCLLGGDVPQSSANVERLNRALSFNVTDKGKVLGVLSFRRNAGKLDFVRSAALKVKDTIPPAPEMTALLRDYREELRTRNIEFASEEGMDPIASRETTADTYVGQQACVNCHPQAHRVNFAAAHTHAYETLAHKNSEFDPECLRCHTVGYGARDGFLNLQRTPNLAGVQCENCHGRGADHIRAMQARLHAASTFRPVTPNTCVRCHDRENSENFSFAAFWPKIAHGRS